MAHVIIGSAAAQLRLPDWPRHRQDLDIFVTTDDHFHYSADIYRHPLLDRWIRDRSDVFATVDELYTIKLSHSYWELKNGSWDKHIFDMRWLKSRGANLLPTLHDTLYKVWEEKHGVKRTNLQMDKGSFFKDAVTRIYDHDSIHDSVAFGDRALYESILKDGSTVEVDNRKMWALPFDQLVLLFGEEVAATALERILIPTNYKYSPGAAYRWALRRTITSLTKGKSARFILENFESFAKPDDYLQRHLMKKDRLVKL